MFDSVIRQASPVSSRFGTATLVSVALHVAALAFAIGLGMKSDEEPAVPARDFPVVHLPPRPQIIKGSPQASSSTAKPATRTHHKNTLVPQPVTTTVTKTESNSTPDDAQREVGDGEQFGDPNGSPTGSPDGVLNGDPNATSLGEGTPGAFIDGMTRPVLLSGAAISYPREAVEAHVEGTMLVRCVITLSGTLEQCQVVKGLSHMNDPVLQALATYRFKPVTFQGKPVSVQYVLPIRVIAR